MNASWDQDGNQDDEDDWEADDPAVAGDDSDDEPTVPCPYCKDEILENSPYCPHCGQYISEEEHPGPKKPLWVFLTVLVCLAVALWMVFAGF